MEPTHLLTFSLPRTARAIDEDLHELHDRRRAFYRWMQRQPWGLVRQGWIVEAGEQHGQLHVHALVRMRSRFLPYSKIQDAARRLSLGVPDFQPVWRQESAARYVAKYMAKDLGAVHGCAPVHGCARRRAPRRFGMSNHLTLPKNLDWSLAIRDDDLPVPWSFLTLVLSSPIHAIPSG